jgi:hypothetical protein
MHPSTRKGPKMPFPSNCSPLGVLDVADADTAVSWGPGLRWGVMGPNMLFHLAGGAGGIQHFMEHLSGLLASWWRDLGSFTDRPDRSKQTIVEGVLKEANGRTVDQLGRRAMRCCWALCSFTRSMPRRWLQRNKDC